MVHFVPCHKNITAEESSELCIDIFYRLHGVTKVIVISLGLHIRSQKCKHLRDQKPGPLKLMAKVYITSYTLLLSDGGRLHPVFHCAFLSHYTTCTSLRPRQTEIEGDMEDY